MYAERDLTGFGNLLDLRLDLNHANLVILQIPPKAGGQDSDKRKGIEAVIHDECMGSRSETVDHRVSVLHRDGTPRRSM